ncbi:MAG: type II secretion system F family protein [Candidatus Pacebacteria bacterium]|nr:type II secretion system F family protein [Candidatus Paceibacterota bacterium]
MNNPRHTSKERTSHRPSLHSEMAKKVLPKVEKKKHFGHAIVPKLSHSSKKIRAKMGGFRMKVQAYWKTDQKNRLRLSMKERSHFAKRLSFLISGGVPLLEALFVLQKQNRSRRKEKFFDSIIADISNGQTLSKALVKFPRMFDDFAVNIIRVGESSGTLNQNLQYLAEELKKKNVLRNKVLSALVYPIFITITTLALTILLTIFIFPKIQPIFTSLRVAIPLTTRILIFTSAFLRAYGLWLLAALVVSAIVFLIFLKKSEGFRKFFDRNIFRIPLLGTIFQGYNLANITRTLGLLLKSGVKLSEAVIVTADTTANVIYKQELHNISAGVLRGEKLSFYMEKNRKLFPDLVSHMVAVGEGTGNLSNTLIYLSESEEAEVDDLTKNLSNSIEPLLMVFMGLIVGFIAVSVITPIYEITQNLHP